MKKRTSLQVRFLVQLISYSSLTQQVGRSNGLIR
jgi:hypothetical protein